MPAAFVSLDVFHRCMLLPSLSTCSVHTRDLKKLLGHAMPDQSIIIETAACDQNSWPTCHMHAVN